MINFEITEMHLKALTSNIRNYTKEPNIYELLEKLKKSIESCEFELFKYCCTEIQSWYANKINAILNGGFVNFKDGHKTSKKNIDAIVNDIHENSKEYIKLFENMKNENNNVLKHDITKCDFNKVFIVHGHDNEAKTEVARYLEQFGLKSIILHEQASEGKTIIEKIEKHTDVGFSIVLYTPCDLGGKNEEAATKYKNRARQNVVFEHGFLISKIGREKVVALVKGDIELPNDMAGVVYIKMDLDGAWKLKIAKEMKACGYSVDMNKL